MLHFLTTEIYLYVMMKFTISRFFLKILFIVFLIIFNCGYRGFHTPNLALQDLKFGLQ